MSRYVALNLVFALAGAAFLAACSSAPPTAMSTQVADSETMHGRMTQGRKDQTFSFEGVESSLLDFTVHASTGADAAPEIAIIDPEGSELDVAAATASSPGAATFDVRGLVLPKTGNYRVVARPATPDRTVFYSFKHRLRYAAPIPRRTQLTADKPAPVYFSAPRGGFVVVRVQPDRGAEFKPDIIAVKDPWGGPALDRGQVPAGARPPRVSHAADKTLVLTFTAPRPGVYTVLAGAKAGGSGLGTVSVQIRKPRGSGRYVYHGGAGVNPYGTPGSPATAARSGAAAPSRARAPAFPSAAPSYPAPAAGPAPSQWGSPDGPGSTPPPPPPPSSTASRVGALPTDAPLDPPIAQR